MSSTPAIRVSGLEKRYGETHALRGLDFEIPSGQLTGFLGPNGAGKTTTFRAVLGLTRPNAGQMEMLGMPVPQRLQEVVKRVGVIVEEPGILKTLSGRVNLVVAADTLGFGHERIDEMLDFVGDPPQLSGMPHGGHPSNHDPALVGLENLHEVEVGSQHPPGPLEHDQHFQ